MSVLSTDVWEQVAYVLFTGRGTGPAAPSTCTATQLYEVKTSIGAHDESPF